MRDCGERCSWQPVTVAPPRLLFSSDGGGPIIDPDPDPSAGPGPEILPGPAPAPAPAPAPSWAMRALAVGLAVVGIAAAAVIGGTVGAWVGLVLVVSAVVVGLVEVVQELAEVGPAPAARGLAKALGAAARGDWAGAWKALEDVPALSWVWLLVLVLVVARGVTGWARGRRGKG